MADPTEFPPMGPRRVPRSEPVFNIPGVVLWLVGGLALIHAVTLLLPLEARWALIQHFGVLPAHYRDLFAGKAPLTWDTVAGLGTPLLTYGLLHGSLLHLGFNSVWLLALGTPIARRLGSLRFLEFFFLCSIIGIVFYIAVRLSSDVPVVGASGGISGLMGGIGRLMFAPKGYDPLRKRVASLLDRRVVTFAVVLTVSNAVFALGSFDFTTDGAAVAWQAHVGGFLAGLLLYGLFDDGRPRDWPPLYRPPEASGD